MNLAMLPPKLSPNGTIGIVSPSGSFVPERLQPALSYLRNRAFQIREGQSIYAQNRYLAGTDAQRATDLNAMFANPDVDAIFVSRGGYGSARILELLDWATIAQNPKPLLGLSDTTALQLALFARTNLVSYSGLALCSDITAEGLDPTTEQSVWNALCHHAFPPVKGLTPLRSGTLSGPLIGGCLSLLTSLIGTPYLPNFKNTIMFLEDVHEPPYRIDRMLNQLLMAGIVAQTSGVLFGEFVGCDPDKPGEGTLADVLADFTRRVSCPVYTNLPYGHGKSRRVIPIGLCGRVVNRQLIIETAST